MKTEKTPSAENGYFIQHSWSLCHVSGALTSLLKRKEEELTAAWQAQVRVKKALLCSVCSLLNHETSAKAGHPIPNLTPLNISLQSYKIGSLLPARTAPS